MYIINYSRVRPDDAIMSINLFRKDAVNKANPIIRALAVRTMSSLRVPKLNEYLVEPLKIALKDEDPYYLQIDKNIAYNNLSQLYKNF